VVLRKNIQAEKKQTNEREKKTRYPFCQNYNGKSGQRIRIE